MAIPKKESKETESYTLDREVISRVKDISGALGLSASSFVNMQLRVALGMVDQETSEYLNKKRGSRK
jgi:hypothetical protein